MYRFEKIVFFSKNNAAPTKNDHQDLLRDTTELKYFSFDRINSSPKIDKFVISPSLGKISNIYQICTILLFICLYIKTIRVIAINVPQFADGCVS